MRTAQRCDSTLTPEGTIIPIGFPESMNHWGWRNLGHVIKLVLKTGSTLNTSQAVQGFWKSLRREGSQPPWTTCSMFNSHLADFFFPSCIQSEHLLFQFTMASSHTPLVHRGEEPAKRREQYFLHIFPKYLSYWPLPEINYWSSRTFSFIKCGASCSYDRTSTTFLYRSLNSNF